MTPTARTVPGRSRSRLRPWSNLALGAARLPLVPILAVLLAAAGGSGPAWTAPARPYQDIPARRWDWRDLQGSPEGRALADQELRRQGEYVRRWRAVHDLVGPQHVSRKGQDLLRRRGLGPALLDRGDRKDRLKTVYDGRDTLRVLVVRISFAANRDSALTTIAPDGDFDLAMPPVPEFLAIDPPPHDKAFYEAHLQGLSEYYRFQSGSRLHIEGRVLPEDPLGSYKLSDVADYGPGADGFWTLEGLERLVRDMIASADQGALADGSARLADFDDDDPFTYIIFVHAGSDWQSDINGDSPNDIPTFFVTLGEAQPLASTDSESGLAGRLTECSIIPETTSQDGYPGSIAAAFYHEFGHALGLVDVYNTQTATPTAGIWDLMDSGTNLSVTLGDVTDQGDTVFVVATGVLPPSLGAWNKWFLGWLEMDEIAGQSLEYRLPAVGVPRDQYLGGANPIYTGKYGDFNLAYPQAWRAGASPREWFLLENRWVPLDVSETPFFQLSFERDEQTGVILYLAGERPVGSWNNSGLYDYFMPAGGLLAWHVNADRIEAGLADNTINTQGDGLALVEADGIRDIGVLDAYVLGWFGSERDPFGGYDGLGQRTGNDNLYADGFPDSRAADRSWTGLSLTDVRPNAGDLNSVLRFGAAVEPLVPGFPWELPDSGPGVPRAIDPQSPSPLVFADGTGALVFADAPDQDREGDPYPSCLFALGGSGQPRWPAVPGLPTGAFQQLGAPLAGPCTVVADGSARPGVLWSTTDGRVGLTDLSSTGAPEPRWSVRVGGGLAGPAVLKSAASGQQRILVPVAADTVVVLHPDDGRLVDLLDLSAQGTPHEFQGGIRIASAQADGAAFAFAQDGWFALALSADGQAVQAAFHPYGRAAAAGSLRPALWTGEGLVGLAVFDADGLLGSWLGDPAGEDWRAGPDFPLDGALVADPAVADLDGDGRQDLVLGTERRVHAYSTLGVSVRGWPATLRELFPLADSTRIQGPLVVADGTGDGVNEVYFTTDLGHLLGLDAAGGLLDRTPFRWGDRRAAGLAVGPGAAEGEPRVLWLLSQGGYAGPPLGRQLTGGRICGYTLAPVAPGPVTSEWLGPQGGTARSGSSGTPAPLGDLAPALAEVDQAVLYPNPLGGQDLTVRFYNQGSRPARFAVYTLEGETVVRQEVPVLADQVNEFTVALPGLASGLYVCRLECDTTAGRKVRTLTLAVER